MSEKKKRPSLRRIIMNGLFAENPTFRLVLGVCPTLAVTTSAMNGVGMGIATTFVLVGSNLVVSLLRNFIPNKVRIPAFVIVICSFVTTVQTLTQAFLPSLYNALGLFLPLIVVNCIVLMRAESFASSNPPLPAAMDGLGMGLGFTLALTLIGTVRELIGSGSILGMDILGAAYEPMLLVVIAPGAFITFGLLLGCINALSERIAKSKASKGGAQA